LNPYLALRPGRSEMKLFGNAKRRKELSAAANTLRRQGIQVTGPYRRSKGILIFSVGDSVMTETELLRLPCNGEIEAATIQQILRRQ
jgi:hypothetical protein